MNKTEPEASVPFSGIVLDLLAWYDRHGRTLPFRSGRTPYRVLVAEFMLQQTQTTAMQPYHDRFLKRWPTVQALSAASEEEVLAEWAGLGYYRRAVSLKRTADIIAGELEGVVPQSPDELQKLPGIGAYTAGAVASIAFGIRTPAVDGNVVRVVSRLTRQKFRTGDSRSLKAVTDYIDEGLPEDRPGDVNEALMDLSASVCRPKKPDCANCPLTKHCLGFRHQDAEQYPAKKQKKASPEIKLTYVALHDGQKVLIRKRQESLLKDTWEFIRFDGHPDTEHQKKEMSRLFETDVTSFSEKQFHIQFESTGRHVFSHRIWDIRFYIFRVSRLEPPLPGPSAFKKTTLTVGESSQEPAQPPSKVLEQVQPEPALPDTFYLDERTYSALDLKSLAELPFSALFRPLTEQLESIALPYSEHPEQP